jgi:hypothetical protein
MHVAALTVQQCISEIALETSASNEAVYPFYNLKCYRMGWLRPLRVLAMNHRYGEFVDQQCTGS